LHGPGGASTRGPRLGQVWCVGRDQKKHVRIINDASRSHRLFEVARANKLLCLPDIVRVQQHHYLARIVGGAVETGIGEASRAAGICVGLERFFSKQ